MSWQSRFRLAALSRSLSLAAVLAGGVAWAQDAPPPQAAPPQPRFALPKEPQLEPRAVELLQAMSARLAAAKSMSFTAVTTYESPARTGLPLAYTTISSVTVERPDKLRVITPADGPPSEFYYDGKTMVAFAPDADLAARADAPPTLDAMLREVYGKSATYFPFADFIVADPWGDLAPNLRVAFVVGQSQVVGGTPTDIVAIVDERLQAQLWIGAEDKLPRRIQASFFDENGYFRHTLDLSDWQIDPPIAAGTFTSAKATAAKAIPFAAPGAP
jgi:hypothetical protein